MQAAWGRIQNDYPHNQRQLENWRLGLRRIAARAKNCYGSEGASCHAPAVTGRRDLPLVLLELYKGFDDRVDYLLNSALITSAPLRGDLPALPSFTGNCGSTIRESSIISS